MKTSHQLARELLAGPDLPVWHFDPSRAGLDDEIDTSLSELRIEKSDSRNGVDPEDIEEFEREGCYMGEFLTICGEIDPEGEAMSDSESKLRNAAQNILDDAVALEGGKNRVVSQALLKALHKCLHGEGGK